MKLGLGRRGISFGGSGGPPKPVTDYFNGFELGGSTYTGGPTVIEVENYIGTTDIGIPGTFGFGVGLIEGAVPEGFTLVSDRVLDEGYANYEHVDGGTFVCVPLTYYRIGHKDNPTYSTYGVNSIDIKRSTDFQNVTEANAAGYALHRAFIDGGYIKPYLLVMKYMASKKAKGAGFIASSVKNGNPISTHADHNPIAELTACSGNYYYETINACKGITGADGAYDSNSPFFCNSRYIHALLAMLSLAHGQAVAHRTACAWYDATYNFPKGCNNNALGDANDGTVSYQSDGYSNCGKTGSGVPFAKTTHNGQACGVADVNGLMYEIQIGMTCIATSKTITAATQSNPCQLEVVGHGITSGQQALITSVGGMTQLNDTIVTVTVVDADHITLDGVDSTGYGAYTGGGSLTTGTFYSAKPGTKMRDFTAGNTTSTDHWGATGVAAMMDPLSLTFAPGTIAMRMGNAANQVLAEDLSGDAYRRTCLGLPLPDGQSTAGSNLFGTDYYYRYIRNEMCPIASYNWVNGTNAGVWGLSLYSYRTSSNNTVGFRAACYPEGGTEL